jgi:hypothetical protein
VIAVLAAAGLGLLALPTLFRRLGRHLKPGRWSALCATALAGGAALVIGAGVLSSLSTALRAVGLPKVARACDAILGHLIPAGSTLALPVIGVTLTALVLGVRALHSAHQTAKRSWVEPGVGVRLPRGTPFEVVVLEDSRLRALSVPSTMGRRSQVLLTTGLLDAVSSAELDLVCAHEEAHLRLAHSRYLALAGAVERAMWFWPPVKASARALRLALERWADEAATGSVPLARARLRSALLTVAVDGECPTLAAFSALDGLVERLTAMSEPDGATVSATWWPVLLFPGLLLGAAALFALGQLGHDTYCLLSMTAGCGMR